MAENNEFIKITGEDNLFYDSIRKEYRHRMHCQYCGKPSGCWCYPGIDSVPLFEDERPNTYCTDVHFVLDNSSEVREISELMKLTIKLTMEEWTASKIIKSYMEEVDANYGDYYAGQGCSI
jgi:hypothetical protein